MKIMNENFTTFKLEWEEVFNCQIPESLINIEMGSDFSYIIPYDLKSKIPRIYLLVKCRKESRIVKIKIYIEKKNEIKELEDGLASCIKYSEMAELEYETLLSKRPDIYISAYQDGSVYIERKEPFFFPWEHIFHHVKTLLSQKIQVIASFLHKHNLKKEFKINQFISIHLDHRETKLHIDGKYSITINSRIFINEDIITIPTSKRHQEFDNYDNWFAKEYIGSADTTTEYVDFITAFDIYSKTIKEWAESDYTKPTFKENSRFYLLNALANKGDDIARQLLIREIHQHFEQENVSPMHEILRKKYYKLLEPEKQRSLIHDFIKTANGKSYDIDFTYELKKLQKEFKEAGDLIRNSLFRAYKNGYDDSEEFFTLFYDFEELPFEDLLYLLFEEDSPITTQFKYLISKTEFNLKDYKQKLLDFNNLHKKAAKRVITSIIANLTPITLIEEEKQQIAFLSTGVNQTFEETRKYWEIQEKKS